MTIRLFLVLTLLVVAPAASALKSDRDQPAVVDADSVDIDFQKGVRIYTGNVRLRQGTIRLNADKVELRFKDNELESAVAVGNPAVFRQRPEGKDVDIVGEGLFIHLDQIKNIVTLTRNAVLTQGSDSVAGKTIVYNMETEKMQVRSGDSPTRTTKGAEGAQPPPAAAEPAAADSAATAAPTQMTADGEARRPRIVIKPKGAE